MKPQNKKSTKALETAISALVDLVVGVILILVDKAIK